MTKKELYSKALYLYGFYTLCYLIHYYEKQENFEECQIILDVLNESGKHDLELPTRINAETLLLLCKYLKEYNVNHKSYLGRVEGYAEEVRNLIATANG